ncbi:MAG: RNB domain-containing ribonuclease [Clostridia bacterium]|nr:RNB domain-containing ribonuclease [Clostridia bacterium]
MSNHADKDLKVIKIRERVFRAITEQPKDLVSLRSYSVKRKVVDSGNKFDTAIATLKDQGRILVKAGKVSINPEYLKSATFVAKGRGGYLLIDGDSRQWQIDGNLCEGYRTNDRVNIAFTQFEGRQFPFIVSKQNNPADRYAGLIQKPKTLLGRCVKTSHDNLVFIPNDRKYAQNMLILNQKSTLSRFQDKICVMTIIDDEAEGRRGSGIITEVKGDAGNPIHEYDAIAESHGANMSWSGDAIEKEISAIPEEVDLSILKERGITDLRHLSFTTVDPATCKDMDDAIYSTYDENGRLVIYTAVANVTKYVSLNSEIGKKYISGAFTTYAPNKAYNILPPQLSTGICSLNPNVPRRAFVVKTVIDEATGKPISSEFLDAVIESKEKFSYQRAQELVDQLGTDFASLRKKILLGGQLTTEEQVVFNSRVADILWKGFNSRGMIRFETKDEYEIHFDETYSDILDITAEPHIPYHKVIEAFMLTANEESAKFALENDIANIYRVHDQPNEDKMEQAYEFFSYLGVSFDGDLSPMGIKRLIASVAGSYKEKAVNNFLVRMQSKAKYSTSTNPQDVQMLGRARYIKGDRARKRNRMLEEALSDMGDISHFGLQSKHYSHTTSPIRRITDYITHYNILAEIAGRKGLDSKTVLEIAQWANQMQDQIDLAEREFADVNSAIYCEGHIGEVMHGRVSGFKRMAESKTATIEDFVVFVENEDKGIKVQIPASEIIEKGIKNVAISPYGSAIVSKSGNKPLIRLCDGVTFRITEASRFTREVKATTDLQLVHEKIEDVREFVKGSDSPALCAKRQRMLHNDQRDRSRQVEAQQQYALNEKQGRKYQESIESRTGFSVESIEAYHANKNDGINHKKRKHTHSPTDIYEIDDENENQ